MVIIPSFFNVFIETCNYFVKFSNNFNIFSLLVLKINWGDIISASST